MHQIGQLNLAPTSPRAVRSGNYYDRILVENFRIEILLGDKSWHSIDDELDIPLERVLAHVIPGVEGTYDRYEYLPQKRDALEKLAALVDQILRTIDW